MAEVERGAVAYELRELARDQEVLGDLPKRASNLLAARVRHTPDVLAKRWKKLDDAQQKELGEELLEIPRFGVTTDDIVVRTGLSPESTHQVMSAIETYHGTLPFTRAEHLWLDDMRFRASGYFEAEAAGMSVLEWVLAQRAELTDLGRLRSVSGEVLISREWDWIRGWGEFRGSSTYEESRVALEGVVRLFDTGS